MRVRLTIDVNVHHIGSLDLPLVVQALGVLFGGARPRGRFVFRGVHDRGIAHTANGNTSSDTCGRYLCEAKTWETRYLNPKIIEASRGTHCQ
jgi:hypothetical protein